MASVAMKDSLYQDQRKVEGKGAKVLPIRKLEELTGFPLEFIKKELLLSEDCTEITEDKLRKLASKYLLSTMHNLS